MAKKNSAPFVWKHKDGRYLTPSYMGDGDYEVILTKEFTQHAIVNEDWPLSEILECCDGIYDEWENPIVPEPTVDDFEMKAVSIAVQP